MRVLIDTHTFIWFVTNDPSLSPKARDILRDPKCGVSLSVASAWEMSIKYGSGKLKLAEPPEQYVPKYMLAYRFTRLDILLDHVFRAGALPAVHGDPFDRLLAAQSLAERLPLVSKDVVFDRYGVTRLW